MVYFAIFNVFLRIIEIDFFLAFFKKKMAILWQYFDIWMSVFRRVRSQHWLTKCFTPQQDKSEGGGGGNSKSHKSEEASAKAPLHTYNFEISGQTTLWKVNPRPPDAEKVSLLWCHTDLFWLKLFKCLTHPRPERLLWDFEPQYCQIVSSIHHWYTSFCFMRTLVNSTFNGFFS